MKQWKTGLGTPSASRMANVSSHASRVWMTSGRASRWAIRICAAKPTAGRRAASGRSGSRVRTHRPRTGPAVAVEQVGDGDDAVLRLVRVQAHGGVHVGVAANPSASNDVARSQPTVIMCVDSGGAGLGDGLVGLRSAGRWQCESTQVIGTVPGIREEPTGVHQGSALRGGAPLDGSLCSDH